MVLAPECFTANITRIGSFIGVSAFVDQQIVGFGKVSLAIFADKLFLWSGAGSSGSCYSNGARMASTGSFCGDQTLHFSGGCCVSVTVEVLLLLI